MSLAPKRPRGDTDLKPPLRRSRPCRPHATRRRPRGGQRNRLQRSAPRAHPRGRRLSRWARRLEIAGCRSEAAHGGRRRSRPVFERSRWSTAMKRIGGQLSRPRWAQAARQPPFSSTTSSTAGGTWKTWPRRSRRRRRHRLSTGSLCVRARRRQWMTAGQAGSRPPRRLRSRPPCTSSRAQASSSSTSRHARAMRTPRTRDAHAVRLAHHCADPQELRLPVPDHALHVRRALLRPREPPR